MKAEREDFLNIITEQFNKDNNTKLSTREVFAMIVHINVDDFAAGLEVEKKLSFLQVIKQTEEENKISGILDEFVTQTIARLKETKVNFIEFIEADLKSISKYYNEYNLTALRDQIQKFKANLKKIKVAVSEMNDIQLEEQVWAFGDIVSILYQEKVELDSTKHFVRYGFLDVIEELMTFNNFQQKEFLDFIDKTLENLIEVESFNREFQLKELHRHIENIHSILENFNVVMDYNSTEETIRQADFEAYEKIVDEITRRYVKELFNQALIMKQTSKEARSKINKAIVKIIPHEIPEETRELIEEGATATSEDTLKYMLDVLEKMQEKHEAVTWTAVDTNWTAITLKNASMNSRAVTRKNAMAAVMPFTKTKEGLLERAKDAQGELARAGTNAASIANVKKTIIQIALEKKYMDAWNAAANAIPQTSLIKKFPIIKSTTTKAGKKVPRTIPALFDGKSDMKYFYEQFNKYYLNGDKGAWENLKAAFKDWDFVDSVKDAWKLSEYMANFFGQTIPTISPTFGRSLISNYFLNNHPVIDIQSIGRKNHRERLSWEAIIDYDWGHEINQEWNPFDTGSKTHILQNKDEDPGKEENGPHKGEYLGNLVFFDSITQNAMLHFREEYVGNINDFIYKKQSRKTSLEPSNVIYKNQLGDGKKITAIQALLKSYPDFFKNMYEVYILYENYKDQTLLTLDDEVKLFSDNDKYNFNSVFKNVGINMRSNALTPASFAVRVASISINNSLSQSFETKFLTKTIKRIGSRVINPYQSTLTLNLDQQLHFASLGQMLSGLYTSFADSTDHNRRQQQSINYETKLFNQAIGDTADTELKLNPSQFNINQYLLNLFPFMTTQNTFKTTIYVSLFSYNRKNDGDYDGPLSFWKKMADYSEDGNKDPYQVSYEKMPYYVLEDVRFLGQSSSLQYTRDSANRLQTTFPFTYRRSYKIDSIDYVKVGESSETQN